MSINTFYLMFWIGVHLSALLLVGLFIVWSAHNRQFQHMDKARHLPLLYPRTKKANGDGGNGPAA